MSLSLDLKMQIRSMIFVAGEPIPFFWPMRAFIHHNPLHGLEKLPFEQAVEVGEQLFHGAGFLPRSSYQQYQRQGKIDDESLSRSIDTFVDKQPAVQGINLRHWLHTLLEKVETRLSTSGDSVTASAVHAALHQQPLRDTDGLSNIPPHKLVESLSGDALLQQPLYETLDLLFGAGIGEELDELVVKSCLDFFDEGQSVWSMPGREQGFYNAWREVALRNLRLLLRGRKLRDTLTRTQEAEGIIVHVMDCLKIPQSCWTQYFRNELSRLHGWAGFIRWRASARNYYQGQRYPGDLVDFLAVRLTLALALIRERAQTGMPTDAVALQQYIQQHTQDSFIRREFYSGSVLPAWAHRVERAILSNKRSATEKLFPAYLHDRHQHEAQSWAASLRKVASLAGEEQALMQLDDAALADLIHNIRAFEKQEGMVWLAAMEQHAIHELMQGMQLQAAETTDKRPFAQGLFCIDTRSERLRRHLESMGDYQTFGIAGFFGVPVSFMELGKGSETYLCPVLLTPKNLVMETTVKNVHDDIALSALEKVLHELKESVLTPFVTVEAIGLLFGFDMFGKTIAPLSYNRWRSRLHHSKPHTHLLLDKLSRQQADSIVRAVQRAVIAKAVEHTFDVEPEAINDDLIRELREAALRHVDATPLLQAQMKLDDAAASEFVEQLRKVYRVNPADARLQMERLGRIGFTLDEQVKFVSQALQAIGLKNNFSRFVLVVGHGSQSENNPYESALDCGACGGSPGLFNARILAHMANKPAVRQRLQYQSIVIPDDTWFVPAMHNTTTDEVSLYDLELLPSSHTIYLDRLQNGLLAARRLCTRERAPELDFIVDVSKPASADTQALRNAMDWSQVRPEWGLSRNAYFVIGRRALTEKQSLAGRSFLHSYDYRVDRKMHLLENILTGPLVVAQWINMEHYFSTVDNERYGSGSKVYHNVAGRFGVMTGNLSDLRTGLPAQTVLADGRPYHEPLRLINVIEAPLERVIATLDKVAVVRRLLQNGWIRMLVVDPEAAQVYQYRDGQWCEYALPESAGNELKDEAMNV